MSTVTTTKRINLPDLDRELGSPGIQMVDTGQDREISGPVAQATLQAAVDAHVWVDRDANAGQLRDRARQALDANKTFLAKTSPTNAEVVAQVKLLTVECSALIRLVIRALDATD